MRTARFSGSRGLSNLEAETPTPEGRPPLEADPSTSAADPFPSEADHLKRQIPL